MKRISKLLIIFIICIFMCWITQTIASAGYIQGEIRIELAKETINPGDYEPPDITPTEVKPFVDKASIITDIIGVVGVMVLVATLIVLGIKYMTGSVSEKAEYKKSMIPYIVGATIFFAITQILSIILELTEAFNK